jgi:S1-C subfamily serine protease
MKNVLVAAAVFVCSAAMAVDAKPGWFGFGITLHESQPPRAAKWLYVRAVDAEGPAAVAGLRIGDVITAIDGKPVAFATNADVLRFFDQAKPGARLTFSVVRQQKAFTISIRALPLPEKYAARRAASRRYAERHDSQR